MPYSESFKPRQHQHPSDARSAQRTSPTEPQASPVVPAFRCAVAGDTATVQDDVYAASRCALQCAQHSLQALPLLRHKLIAVAHIPEAQVESALRETIRFLDLVSVYPACLTPSPLVDAVWHEMLLFTRWYANFCQSRYARFIHHQPGGSKAQNRTQLHTTLALYKLHFGQPDEMFWGDIAAHCATAECGACVSDL